MKKRDTIYLLIVIMIITLCSCNVSAHTKDENDGHDQMMAYVLFGSKTYKSTLEDTSDECMSLKALESAVALCIDQYNDNYVDELEYLKSMKIQGLPKSIDTINFSGNQHHRRYSHRGWNFVYSDDKGNWNVRKEILLQTVNHVFEFQRRAGKRKILWMDKDYGYSSECDAFAALLYYIHILHDYDESGYNEVYSDVMKIAVQHPAENNPDIFWEIQRILPIIFEELKTDPAYTGLMTDIQMQASEARAFVQDNNDVKVSYEQYQSFAKNLLEKLANKLPTLLKKEQYFSKVFGN